MVGNNNEFPPPPPCPQPKEEGRDAMFVKMMTDQQMEALRKQIAAYSTICEQLEELHMTLLSHGDDHLSSGVKTSNNPYSTNLIGSNSGQKLTRRQRWNPTSEQLLVLERVFDQEGIKTPNPQKVKEITAELAQHGQISEPNVYNWFQNRRARLKKKQIFETEANNLAESLDANVSKSSQNENASTGRNDLARTGNIVPIHSFQACPKPSRDFGRMTSHGRILSWEESHDPPLNSENGKNTDLISSYSPIY